MEDDKNLEKNEGHHKHHGRHCQGLACKCGPMGHKFIKLILAIFIVILLLCIGAAIGSHRSYSRFGDYNNRYNNFPRGGCGMQDDWREDGRQYKMRRIQPVQGEVQIIEGSASVNSIPAPLSNTATSVPQAK